MLRLAILFTFLIGFFFGTYYWRLFFKINCLNENLQIKSTFYEHFYYRTRRTCWNTQSKLFLTIGILSSFERLVIYLPSIIQTWASQGTADIEIVLFLEEKSSINEDFLENYFFQLNQNVQLNFCLFLVQLKFVENTYPPQKKSFYAMKFLSIFYSNRSSWFLRLDDNAYVNLDRLLPWLKSIHSKQFLYIGQGGAGRRNGVPIHFPPGELFCMGGSGIILSHPTLMRLGPWLDQCLKSEILTSHEDVELGRCILKYVHISCTKAYDSKRFFYHHYGPGYEFGKDLTSIILSQAMIIHPIKNSSTFREIFLFYLRKKLSRKKHFHKLKQNFRINYVTFLTRFEFDLRRDSHYKSIDARWKHFLNEHIRIYSENLHKSWLKHRSNWTLTHTYFTFGYHRYIPTYGLESIIDLQLHAHTNSRKSIQFSSIQNRLYVRQEFSHHHRFDYREILSIETINNLYRLNLIVVSNNKDQALKRFVKNFYTEIIYHSNRKDYFTLTILYFFQFNQTIDFLHEFIYRNHSNIRLIFRNQTNLVYNRGLGRQLASTYFTREQLLFFLDVDLIFTGEALERTRRLMIHQLSFQTCFVYFPIIFSSYSNRFKNFTEQQLEINSKNGLFSIYGFGNVAMKKQDLDRIGGWEMNNYEWGDEDVNLFRRFHQYSNECVIFRTIEPDIKHFYHRKMCDGIVNKQRKKMCLDADRILFASEKNMIDYLLNKKVLLREN